MPAQPMPSSSTDKVYVNPGSFRQEDLPIIVLTDELRGFVGWAIKSHTQGNYGHVFILFKPGMALSQDFMGLRVRGLDEFMTPGMMLKFWRTKNLTPIEKAAIQTAVDTRINLPFVKRMYDYLGLVGQFFHIKWINSPWQTFCSEQVNFDYIAPVPRTKVLGIKEPSPSELDAIFKAHPELFECMGFWWDG